MIIRPEFPRHKTVFLINDIPVKSEIDSGEKFTAVSNMSLLTSLRTGKVNNWSKEQTDPDYKGIRPSDIFTTYLSYEYFEEGSFDFRNEVCKAKDRIDDYEYFQLEHQKDVWVAQPLWNQFQALLKEIELVKPQLIIVTGKWALFFLTGCTSLITNQGNYKDKKPLGGLNKFRSSILKPHSCFNIEDTIIVPIYHTIHAMAMPDKQVVMQLDMEKLGWMYNVILDKGVSFFSIPDRKVIYGTSLAKVVTYLTTLLDKLDNETIKIACDIETKFSAMIDCIGFSYKISEAICIPFAAENNPNFWEEEEEIEIMVLIKRLIEHPNALFVLQNGSYDAQYMYKMWGIKLYVSDDTMIKHHVLFNYLPKSLDFLASLYCTHYSYWKNMQTH
jgi:hypothetical protein